MFSSQRSSWSVSKSSEKVRKKLIEASVKSLMDNPELGKALRHSLKGLRSYRSGDLRIISSMGKDTIFFITFGHRKRIYRDLKK